MFEKWLGKLAKRRYHSIIQLRKGSERLVRSEISIGNRFA
jgi:hypothetical protein